MLYYYDFKSGQFRRIKGGRFVKTSVALKRSGTIKGKYPKFLKEYREKLFKSLAEKDKKRRLEGGVPLDYISKKKYDISSKKGLAKDWLNNFIVHYDLEDLQDAY